MPCNEVVVRKESFGGILGRRDGYGFHALNDAGYNALKRLANPNEGEALVSLLPTFVARLNELGFIENGRFVASFVDNKNHVPWMSAPIRVWLEVTSKCNLSCRECFNENHSEFKDDLSFEELSNVLRDLYKAGVLQVTITGGEPLLRKDIWKILDLAFELGFGVRFFTNGTTINEVNSRRLAAYPISHIFASLDGADETNDILRGPGTLPRITAGIRRLAASNPNVTLSVTLHADSLRAISKTFTLAMELGIRSLLIRPLLQYSDKRNPIAIPKARLSEFLLELEKCSKSTGVEYQLNKLPFFENAKSVFIHDKKSDVHFSYFSSHNAFGCVGGNTVVGIKSNGAIMACGFVDYPYVVKGNRVVERPFLDLWNNSNNVTVLRDRVGNAECRSCDLLSVCGGGCRANALQVNGSLDAVDPYCFWGHPSLAPKNLPLRTESNELGESGSRPFISSRTIVTKCGSGSYL